MKNINIIFKYRWRKFKSKLFVEEFVNNKNKVFYLHLSGMHVDKPNKPLLRNSNDSGNKKFQFYGHYYFNFCQQDSLLRFTLMPNFLIKELESLIDKIYKQYGDVKLYINTQSFSAEPMIRYLNKNKITKIKHIFFSGPVYKDIKSHLKYRTKDLRIFDGLNNKKNHKNREHIFNKWDELHYNYDYILNNNSNCSVILGEKEISSYLEYSLNFSKENNLEIFYVPNSGHLPWMPVDYAKKGTNDLEKWESDRKYAHRNFWNIIESIVFE